MNIVPADAIYLHTGGLITFLIVLVIVLILLRVFHVI
jgi:hypothetical protein